MKNQTNQSTSQQIIPGPEQPQETYLLAPYWKQVREKLFPLLEQDTGLEMTSKLKVLAQIFEIVRLEEFVSEPTRGKRGGQEIDRRPLARAFLAKAFFNLSQTRALKEQLDQSPAVCQLCGMSSAPSESTFSRAFTEFARMRLGQLTHAALVKKFVSGELVMHISHDSTAVEAREKAREKALKKVKVPSVKKNKVVVLKSHRKALLGSQSQPV